MKTFFFFVSLFIAYAAHAKVSTGAAVNLYIENDTRDIGGPGSDNAYSSGFKFSYVAADDHLPAWTKLATDHSSTIKEAIQNSKSNFGVSIGQQIYTPNDIRRTDLITDDRPYAAWLYVGLSSQFKNENQSHGLELDLGVVGPEAAGEAIQNGYHKIIAKYSAEGWKHQLRTEPTVQLSYQQRLKFLELKQADGTKYFDAIPFFGGGIGNVAIDLQAGGMVRLGFQLPDDFGPAKSMIDGDNFVAPSSGSNRQSSLYTFAAGRGIGVGHNMFLDGNTFLSSHKVTKYPFIIETEVGFVGNYENWTVAWRFVTRSPEFEQRSVVNSFASISLGYIF